MPMGLVDVVTFRVFLIMIILTKAEGSVNHVGTSAQAKRFVLIVITFLVFLDDRALRINLKTEVCKHSG